MAKLPRFRVERIPTLGYQIMDKDALVGRPFKTKREAEHAITVYFCNWLHYWKDLEDESDFDSDSCQSSRS